MAIQTGDKVPDLLGLDQDGKEAKVSDYKGRKIALYFYPKDNTSGCTAEACSLRDGYDGLKKSRLRNHWGEQRQCPITPRIH